MTSSPLKNDVVVDSDAVTGSSTLAMHGVFDAPGKAPQVGDPLPPLWHWMAFLPRLAHRELGRDGHSGHAGGFSSEEFPRRMFAGARLTFPGVAHVGASLTRRSWVKSLERKTGRSGDLVFVTTALEILEDSSVVITEEQDIVFRPAEAKAVERSTMADDSDWTWRLDLPTDSVTLFRYSALTYNAHRIHYDRDYATLVEGYPGLVVHGPLQAMGLAEVARRHCPDRSVGSFSFRAVRPAFHGENVNLCAQPNAQGLDLAAIDSSSQVTVSAQIIWKGEDKAAVDHR